MNELLVVGAREGGLGVHIAQEAHARGWQVRTAGPGRHGHDIPWEWGPDPEGTAWELLRRMTEAPPFRPPQHIVITIGINEPTNVMDDGGMYEQSFTHGIERDFSVNAIAPMAILHAWFHRTWRHRVDTDHGFHHGIVISSNSAHIARSQSAGYCASKAALSMGVRSMARAVASLEAQGRRWSLYGYEPGWIQDTQMSAEVLDRLALTGAVPHRIPGQREVPPESLARMIIRNIESDSDFLNGTMLRVDGGEE